MVDVGPADYRQTHGPGCGWPGLKVDSHLVLLCIRQMNRVNSRTINIVWVLLHSIVLYLPSQNGGGSRACSR